MVVHWFRLKGSRWVIKLFLNGLGAFATGLTVLVIGMSKFLEGAWVTVLMIPILVLGFRKIHSHYQAIREQIAITEPFERLGTNLVKRVVIPVVGINRGAEAAITFARTVSTDITAVFVEIEPNSGETIRQKWVTIWPDIPLVVLPSPYRSIVKPLIDYLDETDRQHQDGSLAAIILPEFVPARWWQNLLHNQTAWLIKTTLLYRRRRMGFQRVIIDIPYHLRP